jgi:predicted kinase
VNHPSHPVIDASLPTLIVISGMPATGKCTLAVHLADRLGWPAFTKDTFKEQLFDVADHDEEDFDEAVSERMGAQAIALLLTIADTLLTTRVNVVLEANFRADLTARELQPLLSRADVRHVYCTLDTDQIVERYQERLDNDERHPVHVDTGDADELLTALREKNYGPIRLEIPTLVGRTDAGFDPSLADIVAFCSGQGRRSTSRTQQHGSGLPGLRRVAGAVNRLLSPRSGPWPSIILAELPLLVKSGDRLDPTLRPWLRASLFLDRRGV